MIDASQAENIFNSLYSGINGYDISNSARKEFSGDTANFLYGELPFQTWIKIVEQTNPKQDGVFFDLGSGTGKVVIASYMLFNFKKIIGVELLDGLHDKAVEIKEIFDKTIRPQVAESLKGREMKLVKESFFDTDLREADFVFMNHPFKDGPEFVRLEEKFLDELKPGTKITTIIRSLKNPKFKQLGSQSHQFSWGDSTVHFCER
jgi:SAM-dependent methyltransferase